MIRRWDIITIGNLSRNRYWGEKDDQAYRPPLCTCTLVQGDMARLIVDPSMQHEGPMEHELERRTGLKLGDVNAVFITHAHGDHHYGLRHFPQARWLAAQPVADLLNASGQYDKEVEHAPDRLFGDIDVLHTPGHTPDHYSLRFDWEGYSVVIAADAAVTRDHWRDRRGYFNSTDFEVAAKTIEELARLADIVVPGHDNAFYVRHQ